MHYKVRIKAKATWTKAKRQLFWDALHFAHIYLDFCKMKGIGRVDFHLTGDPYAPGSCIDADDRYIVHISGAQTEDEIVETLFHELTHVKQYEDGHLQDIDEDVVYWLGNYYRGDFQDTFSKTYWNAPWEVEAREVGEELRKNYYQI